MSDPSYDISYLQGEVENLRSQLAQAKADVERLIPERDGALTQWQAHQKNVPCSGCKNGHDTFWKSVIESAQWKAWCASGPTWDVDECTACGHISQAHFQAFLDWQRDKIPHDE